VIRVEQRNQNDKARLAWLRAAAKVGFDAIGHGDYTSLRSKKEIKNFLWEIHAEAAAPAYRRRRIASLSDSGSVVF
jgi:hypothetical protein